MFGRKPSPGTMLFHRAGAQRKLRRLEGESKATRRELKESRASMAGLKKQVEEMRARLEENARAEAAKNPQQVVFPKLAAPQLRAAVGQKEGIGTAGSAWQAAGAWKPGAARLAAPAHGEMQARLARPKTMREHQIRFLDLNSRAVHGELAEAEAREYSEYLKRGFGRMLTRRAG